MTTLIRKKVSFTMGAAGQPPFSARMEYVNAEEFQALEMRREWMSLMGFSEEEIDEYCDAKHGPASLHEEQVSLAAARTLRGR